jgi:hypothetical protein
VAREQAALRVRFHLLFMKRSPHDTVSGNRFVGMNGTFQDREYVMKEKTSVNARKTGDRKVLRQECRREAGMDCDRKRRLSCDGVGGLIVTVDQRTKGVDQVFNLSLLQPEEIELPGDLVQLGHGLFVGYAIGIHSSPHFCCVTGRSLASVTVKNIESLRKQAPESNGIIAAIAVRIDVRREGKKGRV